MSVTLLMITWRTFSWHLNFGSIYAEHCTRFCKDGSVLVYIMPVRYPLMYVHVTDKLFRRRELSYIKHNTLNGSLQNGTMPFMMSHGITLVKWTTSWPNVSWPLKLWILHHTCFQTTSLLHGEYYTEIIYLRLWVTMYFAWGTSRTNVHQS